MRLKDMGTPQIKARSSPVRSVHTVTWDQFGSGSCTILPLANYLRECTDVLHFPEQGIAARQLHQDSGSDIH